MDQLPNRNDLRNVEVELTNKIHMHSVKLDKRIQDSSREIHVMSKRLQAQEESIAKLEEEVDKQRKQAGGR